MSSASSPVSDTLADYVAGRASADRVVAEVARAYYGTGGRGTGEGLRPLIELIERAAPGMVELAGTAGTPGFEVRLAGRPFPTQYEEELRRAIRAALERLAEGKRARGAERQPEPGVLRRVWRAVRRLFGS